MGKNYSWSQRRPRPSDAYPYRIFYTMSCNKYIHTRIGVLYINKFTESFLIYLFGALSVQRPCVISKSRKSNANIDGSTILSSNMLRRNEKRSTISIASSKGSTQNSNLHANGMVKNPFSSTSKELHIRQRHRIKIAALSEGIFFESPLFAYASISSSNRIIFPSWYSWVMYVTSSFSLASYISFLIVAV